MAVDPASGHMRNQRIEKPTYRVELLRPTSKGVEENNTPTERL